MSTGAMLNRLEALELSIMDARQITEITVCGGLRMDSFKSHAQLLPSRTSIVRAADETLEAFGARVRSAATSKNSRAIVWGGLPPRELEDPDVEWEPRTWQRL